MYIKTSKTHPSFNSDPNEIPSESVFLNRRQLIKRASLAVAAASFPLGSARSTNRSYSTQEAMTSEYSVTHYNNFYEFSLMKDGPAQKAKDFKPLPWHVVIEGEVNKPGRYAFEDILKWATLEERIYRLRCVEAWSMVIPWTGFELNQLIKRVEPTSNAKFIEFQTLLDPKQMPGQQRGALGFFTLPWPYKEGLRMDEALNPLTILATGVYGNALPPQNGAPLRLIVPWKYGFKSIKSIVKIRFIEQAPINTWQESAPSEYGFFANVNPNVDHPRWSQAKERRIIDESLFGTKRIATKLFNGYAEQVGHMYSGMDLSRFY